MEISGSWADDVWRGGEKEEEKGEEAPENEMEGWMVRHS